MPNTVTPIEQDPFSIELANHLLNEMTDYAIFMMDFSGRIVTWNPGVKRLLGYAEHEFIGKQFSSLFTPEDVKLNAPATELTTAAKNGRADDQRWHLKKDGSTFWANGILTLSQGEVFGKKGFVKVMRDQTAQRNYETELANYTKKLAATNKDLVNFAGVVSHDLNAPLQTVLGFTTIIEEKAKGVDDEVDVSLHHIREGAERMLSLVSELLQFTTSTNKQVLMENVNCEDVLEVTLAGLSKSIEKSRAKITHSSLPQVKADATQLGRIFQNLIENAIKYSKENVTPEIHISASRKGSNVAIRFEDNGIGMSPEDSQKLFTLFERLSTKRSTGFGIGLATCKRVAEMLGGDLTVESKKDEGSAFTVTIPAAQLELAPALEPLKELAASVDIAKGASPVL